MVSQIVYEIHNDGANILPNVMDINHWSNLFDGHPSLNWILHMTIHNDIDG